MTSRPFSVVLPVRGTKREMGTIPRALQSAAALEPDELVVAIDADAPDSLEVLIRRSCPMGATVRRVRRDRSWNFQLAKCVYESYAAATHDAILCYDCDSALTPAVLGPLGRLGRDGVAVISFLKDPKRGGFAQWVRRRNHRRMLSREAHPFSGVYWIWRPFYMELVRPEGFRRIYNAIDSYMMDRLREDGRYEFISVKEIGAECFDIQSGDYPVHQFATGIWFGSAIDRRDCDRRCYRAAGPFRGLVAHAIGAGRALLIAATRWHPWIIYGYAWAVLHPRHEAVHMAKIRDLNTWHMDGMPVVARIRDWSDADRDRTGFPKDAGPE